MLRVRPRMRGSVGGLVVLWLMCGLSQPPTSGAEQSRVISPLPASNYSVRRVCPPPPRGGAVCLALQLVPETPAARAFTHPLGMALSASEAAGQCRSRPAWERCFGLRPQDLHAAYELPPTTEASGAQTVALVDAYD